jgi:LPS-assembly protein
MRPGTLISSCLRLIAALCVAIWAGAATAQDGAPPPAMLVADDVYLEGNERLVATGNVEALYDGRRLRAQQIIYDRQGDRLLLTGPIVIVEGEERIILAESGEIDQQLENGILRGARMIMGDHVQLAAQELNRSGGRYNQLAKVSVTSCRVCETGRAPLWQIRARRVIHDQEAQQLYFEDAQFRVMDTPIFYLPRLRLPDPTLERSAGFLIPSLHSSSVLGVGVKVPYFIPIGDHKDLTITPFLTNKTRTLEMRYRQAFRKGRVTFQGAVSDDDLTLRDSRGYLFGDGEFRYDNGVVLRFDVEAVSDDTYLLDYNYFEKDRLDSEIELEFVDRDSYRRGALTYYHTLRPGENSTTLAHLRDGGRTTREVPPLLGHWGVPPRL